MCRPANRKKKADHDGFNSFNGFSIAVAGRHLAVEPNGDARAGYAALFAEESIALDGHDPSRLVLFPEMDATADVAEITTTCWGILGKSPGYMMCATSRMVVHRRGEENARVVACTLIPHDKGFDLGRALADASHPVALNHPHRALLRVGRGELFRLSSIPSAPPSSMRGPDKKAQTRAFGHV